MSVVRIANERPDDEATLIRNFFLRESFAVIDRGILELVFDAEAFLGIGEQGGKKIFALIPDEERLIVGVEFGEQRDEKQDQKKPERIIASPVCLEIAPAPLVDR